MLKAVILSLSGDFSSFIENEDVLNCYYTLESRDTAPLNLSIK